MQTSPLPAGIISSGRMGTCSEVGDTSYCNTLELSCFCMPLSSPIILSSNIFWELKYLRLKTHSLFTKQNHPLSAASLPTFSLETHFFYSCLDIHFIQLPTSTRPLRFPVYLPFQQTLTRSMDILGALSFCSLAPNSRLRPNVHD